MESLPGQLLRTFNDEQGTAFEVRLIELGILAESDKEQSLFALYQLCEGDFTVLLSSDESMLASAEAELCAGKTSLLTIGRSLRLPVINSGSPATLVTVAIGKPWGHEVWYTGIEERGISSVKTLTIDCPLNWWLAVFPASVSGLGPHDAPILLKILAPHDEQVLGDLYFELHEIKREVYVISAISEMAWPDGVGAIRIGFNPQQRAQYQSEEDFKQAYAMAVAAYRQIRCQIDDWLSERQLSAVDPCALESVKKSLEHVPAELSQLEEQRRQAMEGFTQLHPIRVGDVVVIPRNLPHSLQHGVRAVEFQTPVYERKIVSFAQRVLTQSHWDTEEALRVTDMRDYEPTSFDDETVGQGSRQKIVDFDDFSVWRYSLPGKTSLPVGAAYSGYMLLMTLLGKVSLAGCELLGEQAAILPASVLPGELRNTGTDTAVVLLAAPR